MLINKISFPYPVLNIIDDIEGDFDFTFDVKLSPDIIILDLKINLINDSLHKLIVEKKAAFCLEIQNTQTFFRESCIFSEKNKFLTLKSDDLRGKVVVFVYIVALQDIKNYSLKEFNQDYSNYSFEISKGDTLALGGHGFFMAEKSWADFMSVSSFMEVQKGNFKTGPVQYNLNESKVLVILSEEDYKKYSNVYKNDEFLNVFLAVIVYPALLYLLSYIIINPDEHKDNGWYLSLMQRCANEPKLGKISEWQISDIVEKAQELLKDPKEKTYPMERALFGMQKTYELLNSTNE